MHAWSITPSRPSRRASVIVAAAGAVLTVGCMVGGEAVGPIFELAPDPGVDPGMIPCGDASEFTFVGETSLAALGLANEFGGGPDVQRTGMVWVTAGDAGAREVCVQWPDGSGMGGTVSGNWRPPGERAADSDANSGGSGTPPLGALVVLAVLTLIAGVSYVAFRGERS